MERKDKRDMEAWGPGLGIQKKEEDKMKRGTVALRRRSQQN
jgi:hypothetical protein